jgi:hypothetical protein
MYFPMDWWGVRKATKAEGGILKDSSGKDLEKSVADSYTTIDGTSADEGDYLFKNASMTSAGTANHAKSPFYQPTLSTKLIEKKQTIIIYNTTHHVQTNMNAIALTNCHGLNPVNGFSKFLLPFDVRAYHWRLVDQTLTELHDKKGKIWTRIERKMEYAPLGLFFDPDKNGGTWVW